MKHAKEPKGSVTPEVTPHKILSLDVLKAAGQGASNALVTYGENPFQLVLPDTMHEGDYLAYGANIGKAMEFASWRIGDYVNFGLTKFGYKDYGKLAGVTGMTEEYLRACSSVAGRVLPELRQTASMERARLLLTHKNEKESVPHVFERLAKKTLVELRNLRKGASTPAKKKKEPSSEITATELYETAQELLRMLEGFDSKNKLAALQAFEADPESGKAIFQLSRFIQALADQLVDVANV